MGRGVDPALQNSSAFSKLQSRKSKNPKDNAHGTRRNRPARSIDPIQDELSMGRDGVDLFGLHHGGRRSSQHWDRSSVHQKRIQYEQHGSRGGRESVLHRLLARTDTGWLFGQEIWGSPRLSDVHDPNFGFHGFAWNSNVRFANEDQPAGAWASRGPVAGRYAVDD